MPEFLNLHKRIEELTQADDEARRKESLLNIYDRINELLDTNKEKVESTALPAIKLYLYNFLIKKQQATEKELEKAFQNINRLSKLEKEYGQENNILPTIGIEIEIPRENLTREKAETLYQLHVSNEGEGSELWEVNPEFSYSPWVQSRIIQELAKMEALPLEKNEASQRKVVGKELLSLHVNFGMPVGISRSNMDDSKDKIVLMNDTLIYAFTSVDRIKGRKTNRSVKWRSDAKESKKNKNKNENEYLYNDFDLLRLELRAGEFRDYPTYRMLAEAQRLTAMLISQIKEQDDIILKNQKEIKLIELWKKFEIEVKSLFEQFKLDPKMVDNYEKRIIEILNETDLKQECRRIVTKYSKEVQKTLKLEDEETTI